MASTPTNSIFSSISNANGDEIKSDLGILSRADAKHDFSSYYSTIKSIINSGMPTTVTDDFSEEAAFNSLFNGFTIDNLKAIPEGEPITQSTKHGSTYNIFKIIKETSINDLFTIANIEPKISVIVDFDNCHLIESFATQNNSSDKTVFYLMTPEVVNDPAGKKSIFDKTFFKRYENGPTICSCIQTSTENMTYTAFDVNNRQNYNNNFFSNYLYSLSPIRQKIVKGSNRLMIDLTIENPELDKGKGTIVLNDSKSENSIATVIKYISKIFSFGLSNENKFYINSKIQQKRLGDWGQVLACNNAKYRDYKIIFPNENTPNVNDVKKSVVYFVTHDRIALSYALLNDLNSMFIGYDNNGKQCVYVFKNSIHEQDPELYILNLVEKIKKFFIIDEPEGKNEYIITGIDKSFGYDIIEQSNRYNDAVSDILKEKKEDFVKATAAIISSDHTSLINNNNLIVKATGNIFFDFFWQALLLTFSELNLNIIDETIITNFNDRGTRKKERSELEKFVSKINFIDGLISVKFGNFVDNSTDNINSWLYSNFTRLDVFILFKQTFDKINDNSIYPGVLPDILENLSINKESFLTDLKLLEKRIIVTKCINLIESGKRAGKHSKYVDKNLFMPYIIKCFQYIDVNSLQTKLITILNDIFLQLQPIENVDRNNKLRVIKLVNYYNFIEELLIFLTINITESVNIPSTSIEETSEEMTTSEDILKVLISDHSSEIIMKEDSKFMLDGKTEQNIFVPYDASIPNDQAETDIVVGGAKINNFDSSARKTFVYSDYSNFKYTWSLLTYYFTDDLSKWKHLYTKFVGTKRRRDESDESRGGGYQYKYPYHPFLPIYIILSPFYLTFNEYKYESSPYLESYFVYLDILEKMLNKIKNMDHEEANIIGLALKYFLFSSNNNEKLQETIYKNILNGIGIDKKDYFYFSIKNEFFLDNIVGSSVITKTEEDFGISLLSSEIFIKFINDILLNIEKEDKEKKHLLENIHLLENKKSTKNSKTLKERVKSLINFILNNLDSQSYKPDIKAVLQEESSKVFPPLVSYDAADKDISKKPFTLKRGLPLPPPISRRVSQMQSLGSRHGGESFVIIKKRKCYKHKKKQVSINATSPKNKCTTRKNKISKQKNKTKKLKQTKHKKYTHKKRNG